MTSDAVAILNESEQNLAWFRDNYDDLLRIHGDEFVAVFDQKIANADKSYENVLKVLKHKKISPARAVILFVSKTKFILHA